MNVKSNGILPPKKISIVIGNLEGPLIGRSKWEEATLHILLVVYLLFIPIIQTFWLK